MPSIPFCVGYSHPVRRINRSFVRRKKSKRNFGQEIVDRLRHFGNWNTRRIEGILGPCVVDKALRVPIVPELVRDQMVWGPECVLKPKVQYLYEQVQMNSKSSLLQDFEITDPSIGAFFHLEVAYRQITNRFICLSIWPWERAMLVLRDDGIDRALVL